MRSTKDVNRGPWKWLAIGANQVRTTYTLKAVAILLVVALVFAIYMMIGSVADATQFPPLETNQDYSFSSSKIGSTQEEMTQNKPAEKVHASNTKNETDFSQQTTEQYSVVPTISTSELIGFSQQRTVNVSDQQEKKMRGFYDNAGVAPVPCDKNKEASELFNLPPLEFLPHFKNPCWREKLEHPENVYKGNSFAEYSTSYKRVLDKLQVIWQKRNFSEPQYRLRCLPYFFLAGQPKCGSTDLYRRLVTHPDIVTPPTKEPHWFGKHRFASIPFSNYLDLFDEAAMKIEAMTKKDNNSVEYHPVITGDASVSTLWYNDGWWRHSENCGRLEPLYTNPRYIHRLLPGSKIIVILRNPSDRLYSDYLYFHKLREKNQERFHNHVKQSITVFKNCVEKASLRSCVYNFTVSVHGGTRLRVGMYAMYIEEWLDLFPRDQILLIRLEDYATDPLASIRKVHRFLDLRTLTSDENEEVLEKPKANTRREQERKLGGMYRKTRALLDHFYRPFNQKLAHMLGDDGYLWEE